jgi:hypothetical protein
MGVELGAFYLLIGVLACFMALRVTDFLAYMGFEPNVVTLPGGLFLVLCFAIAGGAFLFSAGAMGA